MAFAEPQIEPPLSRNLLGTRTRERTRTVLAGSTVGAKIALGLVAVVMLVALLAGRIAPYDPTIPVAEPMMAPGSAHFFGTDEIGRDLFSRVLFGMQSSWWGAMIVIASGVVFGGLVGLVAGTAGGIVDSLLMRGTDAFLAMPGAVLAVAMGAALGPSYGHTLLAISIVWWPLYARIVRGEVSRLRASPHMDAARVAGAGRARLALRHLLPGAVPPTVVAASTDVGALVVTLAGLSFLGLGAPAPAPELGSMAAHGVAYIFQGWWVPLMPAIGVFVLAVVANFGGDALRDRIRDR
jgi:ABC-type dipeptide/oligopeptide/nickel transport system permease subunit